MSGRETVDGRPVIVGVGESADPLGSPGYRAASSVVLAADAVRAALDDAGVDVRDLAGLRSALAMVRPFDASGPGMPALGVARNLPRAVAARLGWQPDHAILEVVGGQGPQSLVTELAGCIAAGRFDLAVVAGADVLSTLQHFRGRDDAPDLSDATDGQVEDRGFGYEYYLDDDALAHGLHVAPAAYALVDEARRAARGQTREEHLRAMGGLFAPFAQVAAEHPLAAVRTAPSPVELATLGPDNPLVWDPYPRRLMAREKVNLGAAVVLMSADAARRLGVPEQRWVQLRGTADVVDVPLLERADLGVGRAAVVAAEHAISTAGLGVGDVDTFDLYSCFAAPVLNVRDGLGLPATGGPPLTVTGGLPFFGGPGNNYSAHAIAETVRRVRRDPGSVGFVGGNGGILSKYAVGVYSTEPGASRGSGADLAARVADQPRREVERRPSGLGTVAAATVRRDREGRAVEGILIGELVAPGASVGTQGRGGARFLARMDERLLALAAEHDLLGRPVRVAPGTVGNLAAPEGPAAGGTPRPASPRSSPR